ncbi:MAG: hypothetical protein AB4050_16490 [Synechococcus sp.]
MEGSLATSYASVLIQITYLKTAIAYRTRSLDELLHAKLSPFLQIAVEV